MGAGEDMMGAGLDQWGQLSVSVTRKKLRCAECTRPISDESESLLCNRCGGNAQAKPPEAHNTIAYATTAAPATPAAPAPPASAATAPLSAAMLSETSILSVGCRCWYGERVPGAVLPGATIVVKAVHYDDVPPYYTIAVDGHERSTVRAKLTPLTAQEEDAVVHATRTAAAESSKGRSGASVGGGGDGELEGSGSDERRERRERRAGGGDGGAWAVRRGRAMGSGLGGAVARARDMPAAAERPGGGRRHA